MESEPTTYCNNDCATSVDSNPQLPIDYADAQTDLLKGDAIGDTLYSERFVLKTLIKLSQVSEADWCEDFENDLCNLWDMTIEHDVVTLLMKHDFLILATSVLRGPLQEPRFIEIIVGILRNICCFEEVRQAVSERSETTRLLIQLLSTSDSLTLIQLVRLFHSFAWDLVKQVDQRSGTMQKHWLEKQMDCQVLCDKLSFLLRSSTNEELLYGVLDVLNTLGTYGPTLNDKDFSQYFATVDMVGSLLECWQQLFISSASTMGEEGDTMEEDSQVENELFLSKHMFKAAKKWVAVLASFAGHERGREALVSNGDALSTIMGRLIYMQDEDERCEDMLTDIVNIMEALIPSYFVSDIIKKLLTILYDITQIQGDIAAVQEKLTLIDAFENFFESAVRNGSKAKVSEALEQCEGEDHLILLFWSVIQKRDPELMADWKSDIKPFDERNI